MEKRRPYLTYVLIAGALTLIAWAASAMPRLHRGQTLISVVPPVIEPIPPQNVIVPIIPQARPRVEVVFALDTTGSMTGLIDGAKRKIWSIAKYIESGQPRPDLRIGLVAYRDHGDEYVTRFYDLDGDLDSVFEHLSSFIAAGGGDTPEHVSKALHDAVNRTTWTQDQSALKLVYLVGDAPPHTDYQDGFDYHQIARRARERGIRINTIRCGGDAQTQVVWNDIARASAGQYASIDQSGGMLAIATPFDDKLSELNTKLARTVIGYGEAGMAARHHAYAAMRAPAGIAAERADFYGATGGAIAGKGDLVKDTIDGLDVTSVPTADLPAEMAPLAAPARKKFVEEKRDERAQVLAEINTLSAARTKFIKSKKPVEDGFDAKVEAAIKRQARSIGVAY